MSSDSALTIASEVELVPANCFQPLDLPAVYGRVAPLEIDLGCGDGSFLAALARESPEKNFLGIERLLGRVRSACRRIERAGLTNARVMRFEISYAVEHLLPPGSVTAFYLLFPDPWPKRRHAPRRLVTESFLAFARSRGSRRSRPCLQSCRMRRRTWPRRSSNDGSAKKVFGFTDWSYEKSRPSGSSSLPIDHETVSVEPRRFRPAGRVGFHASALHRSTPVSIARYPENRETSR